LYKTGVEGMVSLGPGFTRLVFGATISNC
jgi:hypothetical protein